jgi:ubiquinone/menaquinone biosynthesis C-methylase UbiE
MSIEKVNHDKIQITEQWNNHPCGQVGDITYDLDYFKRVEDNRYMEYGPWMRDFFLYDNPSLKGTKLLEVGFGQGTDMSQYIKSGANCYGIDYTPTHVELAKLNLKLRGVEAQLIHGDASNLPYESSFFDRVVSFGVLHHTPDTQKCFDETHRVLRPGGTLVLSLYHKNSFFFYYVKLFVEGLLKLKIFSLGYKGLMSTVEEGADGKKIKPLVKVYSKSKLKSMLSQFKHVKFDIRHLKKGHVPPIIPKSQLSKLGRKWGWYIIATATK